MSRYIDADKLIELLRDECAEVDDGNRDIDKSTCLMTFRAMHEFVDMIPTADVKDVEHGTWIEAKNPNMFHRCTNCGALWGDSLYYNFHYCPTCGAKMESLKDHKLLHDMEDKRRIIVFLTTDSDDESLCLKDDLRQEIACCWHTFNIVKITEIDMR